MRFEKFENIITDITSKYFKINKELYLPEGEFKIVDQGKDFIGGFTNDKSLVVNNSNPVIIFGDHTKTLKYIDFPFVIGADGVKVLQVNQQKAFSKYIYYFLKTVSIQDAGYSRHFKFLKEVKIPIPEKLEDQIRIAALLSKAEVLIKQRKESIDLLDEYLKSTFLEMFGDYKKMSNSKLDELGNNISYLTSGSRGWAQYYSEKGAIFLRIQNIGGCIIRTDNLIYVNAPDSAEADRTRLKEGDLLISITADLGRTSVVPKNFGEAYISQHLALIRLNENINPIYAAYFYNMPFGNNAIQKKNRAAVKAGLNFNDIKSFPILIPSMSLQTKFANIVEKTESLKTQYKSSLAELENLYGSLSQKAFKGELNLEKGEEMLMAAEPVVGYGNKK
jgi:type I restriction enzyme, S subunit